MKRTRIAVALFATAMLLGCGPQNPANPGKPGNPAITPNSAVTLELRELAKMYHDYHDANRRPPSNMAALVATPPQGKSDPAARQRAIEGVQSGKYVLIWNLDFSKLHAGFSNTVMGYEKDVPVSGGNVLMAEGSVYPMSVQEFQAALKANQ